MQDIELFPANKRWDVLQGTSTSQIKLQLHVASLTDAIPSLGVTGLQITPYH